MPKKVLIALPPAMLEQVDFIAQCEHRTRSDLIREALRRYLEAFKRAHAPAAVAISQPQEVHLDGNQTPVNLH
ncbi:MAG TPA: ribbon-helix-helix domain-containing protein [Oculatellaceae cyanobacterium]